MSKFFSNYSTPGTSSRPELDFSDHWVGYVKSTKQVIYSPKVDVDPNGHQYVDLGLPSGTLWATANINNNSFFAWGEVETKSSYTWDNYKYGTSSSNLTKYNESDGKTTLDLEDDPAHILWGGSWRTPTMEQINEVLNNCTLVTQSSSNRFTSKINGEVLVIASCGRKGTSVTDKSYIYIWSSDIFSSSSSVNYGTGACYSTNSVSGTGRCTGLCIRPVLNVPKRRFLSQEGPAPWNMLY